MLRVTGMRLGVRIYTPHGTARNGAITAPDQRAYLESIGYRLEPSPPIHEPAPSAQERQQLAELERERKNLGQSIARGVREILAPMRKSTYRDSF